MEKRMLIMNYDNECIGSIKREGKGYIQIMMVYSYYASFFA